MSTEAKSNGGGSKFKLAEKYPYYLGNKAVFANTKLKVVDKYTDQVVSHVALADRDTIDKAIGLAVKATKPMAQMPSYKRKEILTSIYKELQERSEELAQALCIEAGKPIRDARGEVRRCVETFEIAAEESVRIYGEHAQLDITAANHGYQSITRRFPIGPVSMISPFNFPLNLVAHKVAPALACGCPFVLKPASRTPVGALILGEIMAKLDLPEGAFSVLPCSRDGADLFTTDDRLKLLSFTGSPDVGWDLKAKAGKKPVVLELGGNAACIVDEGTDIDDAVKQIIHGAYYQSGQSCISVQRIYVHSTLYDAFKEKIIADVANLKAGDPSDEETFLGPMITENDAIRCDEWVKEAVAAGGKLLVGGKRDKLFYDATIVEDVPKGTKLRDSEVFGPVCTLEKFDDFKDAVEKVDDTDFGLQAGVFTSNMNKAFYAFENLEVGGVVINDVPSKRIDSMPYGGVRDSGLGREGLRYAIEDMTEMRLMLMRNIGKI